MSRAGTRPVYIGLCTVSRDCDPCIVAEGAADEDQLSRLKLLARCPTCGVGDLKIWAVRDLKAAIVGR